ncbi:hypothetical protein F8M41_019312 [Gigaspora margarita]|uniref:Uncharacterized protein n=1 Tax=Gigaspora margarita TaxID=4874 RepID=A0A8H3ZUY7_GIGMA|nr:hypothetical protein F8M41_019312 [Gigaspora margarita]
MDIEEILEEEKIEEKSEKLNREYLNSCFSEYMLKLETPSESTVYLEKPQTSEPEEWKINQQYGNRGAVKHLITYMI